MKLAIINIFCSTGGWRYTYQLVKGIMERNSNYEISLFTNQTKNEYVQKIQSDYSVNIKKTKPTINLYSYDVSGITSRIKFPIHILRDKLIQDYLSKQLQSYDIIFYAWPFNGIRPAKVNKPIFYIPHDFILSHGFGLDGLGFYPNKWHQNEILKQLSPFVNSNAIPIVSNDFIKEEFNRVFPNSHHKPQVVYLTEFSDYKTASDTEIENLKKKYNITSDYILFANNSSPHKNLSQVIRAMYYVKQQYPNIKLVISGGGNEGILGKVNCPYYMDHVDTKDNYDIIGLGLLSDEDFGTLLQGAKMVINASFCEAGAGSALDAWNMGVPMVMSNIPAFIYQMNYLGTKAELFSPADATDIARAIIKLLSNPDLANENAKTSKEALKHQDSNIFGQQYIDIFEHYIQNTNSD